MMPYTKKINLWLVIGLLILVVLSACSSNAPITINLRESSVNQFIQNATAAQDSQFWVRGIDMQDGFMRVFISYRKEDGSELNGYYDMLLKVENGEIKADIVDVEMPGLQLDQQILDQISELITRDFIYAATRMGGKVEFLGLDTTEDNLEITLLISR